MKNIKNIIYIFPLIIGLFSCNDYLDKSPLSDYLSSDFYNSEKSIKQGASGAYQSMYMESGQLPFFTLFDMYTPMGIERADNASVGVGNVNLKNSFVVETHWANFYKGVARCNTVIEGAEPFKDELNDKALQYLSEIRVIRAFHYSYLVSIWGDVLFFTKSVTSEEQKTATRKPWNEIIDYLLDDLESASTNLPWISQEQGRIDKSFALGLRARLALYAGSWYQYGFGMNGIKDEAKAKLYYKIAAETANDIILNSGRKLNPNFTELFDVKGQLGAASRSENILELMYSDQGDTKSHYISFGEQSRMFAQSGRFPTQLLVDTYEMSNGKRIDEAGSGYNPQKPFENRDPRLKQTIYTHGDVIIGNTGGQKHKFQMELFKPTVKSIATDGSISEIPNLDYEGSVAQYGYIHSGVGYLWKKYNHFDEETVYLATYNIPLMRYAEVLLIYAEAKIELNELDPTVVAAIDEVRARSGMPGILTVEASRSGDQAKMRQMVRRERKVELARECGFHFFDMRRWRTGQLENAEKTYGFPLAIKSATEKYPDGYTQVTSDMVPTYGSAGSERDLNDLALYAAFGDKLRARDVSRPTGWDDMYYLWPIPQTERNKAPQLTQNDGYGN